ncbi:MAG: ParB/RepB/Spo0J family partition protein [Clostridia bacterium]|nr:ParB/RepB/Spo0J family partition protein [Clostridia bacterium]MBT7121401.1 ParB/RepB/Spo0J family partition protein [Clostridia bacterium]
MEVDVNSIDPNLNQPRKNFDNDKLKELAQSIQTYGVVQPIIVQKHGERYSIIAGERRYRASRMAGIATVPVVVKDYTEREYMEVSLVENLQREDLNPIEEAQAMRLLMDEHNLTQEELSSRLAKSRSAVANTLRLLSLPEQIRDMVERMEISSGHARALVTLSSDEEKIKLAKIIVNLGLSVRATESMINKHKNPDTPKSKSKATAAPEIIAAEQQLSGSLETKVKIIGDLDKGKIAISYYNAQQLQSIYDFLTKDD